MDPKKRPTFDELYRQLCELDAKVNSSSSPLVFVSSSGATYNYITSNTDYSQTPQQQQQQQHKRSDADHYVQTPMKKESNADDTYAQTPMHKVNSNGYIGESPQSAYHQTPHTNQV
eukprot:TRINITY_DN1684_c0_g1_i2.p1 TRINITY_DN1684_c0_g1~~TRINITY_DN1684_c0_g1_i2.p1  ORF type:complete len:116 (-),score=26.68 TRINITY_DN1684_c0_g1_i2:11-358(-)